MKQKQLTVSLPVDFADSSVDEEALQRFVQETLDAPVLIKPQHIETAFAAFKAAPSFETAIKLAGWAGRYAIENRKRPRAIR